GHVVPVVTYRRERSLPAGLRHLWFMLKTLPRLIGADAVILLDSFSVGLPGYLAARLLGKQVILRVGGEFAWELYVERTGKPLLLSEFYARRPDDLSWGERFVLWWTRKLMRSLDAVIFSTAYQQAAYRKLYQPKRDYVVRNYYDRQREPTNGAAKTFLWAGRPIKLKNRPALEAAFEKARATDPTIELEQYTDLSHAELLDKIADCRAVVVPSFSEVSPNLILETLMLGKPFICTADTGLSDQIKAVGLLVDARSTDDIAQKVLQLSDESQYQKQLEKVRAFEYRQTYDEIAQAFLDVIGNP
ncbi:glycosyltransferase, partial [Acidimicrobium ferrooxidans]|nr:glycosyltransferase [Acidimicrobium ferrooxidans]